MEDRLLENAGSRPSALDWCLNIGVIGMGPNSMLKGEEVCAADAGQLCKVERASGVKAGGLIWDLMAVSARRKPQKHLVSCQ